MSSLDDALDKGYRICVHTGSNIDAFLKDYASSYDVLNIVELGNDAETYSSLLAGDCDCGLVGQATL